MPDDSSTPLVSDADPTAGSDRIRGRRTRDRHDRGMRSPAFGDTPLAPGGVPARRTRAEQFDDSALRVLRAVVGRWTERLGDLELAVEEVPVIGPGWTASTVPLASYVERTATTNPRLVLFRRPLEHRAESALELEALLLTVVVEQVAEVLGIPAEDVHPGYESD